MKKLMKFTALFLGLLTINESNAFASQISTDTQEDLKVQKDELKKQVDDSVEKLDASINTINQRMETANKEEKEEMIKLKNDITLERLNLEVYHSKIDEVDAGDWMNTKREVLGHIQALEKYFNLKLPESK